LANEVPYLIEDLEKTKARTAELLSILYFIKNRGFRPGDRDVFFIEPKILPPMRGHSRIGGFVPKPDYNS
jgi:hypothetical protein